MRFKKQNNILRTSGASLKINVTPLGNNTISAPQTICYGATPAVLTGSLPTGTGNYVYNWQQSTNGSTYTNATGTRNARNYQPPSLIANRWYKRTVTTAYGSSTSTAIMITTASQFVAGSISGGGSGKAPYTPPMFQSTAPASGGIGGPTYQWQRNFNGGAYGPAPGGNTSATYQAVMLTPAGTYRFRRFASNTCGSAYTNEIMVVVTI
jgi:hypothetical protein